MTTQTDIVNRALELTGQQATITSFSDGSAAAQAANVIYTPTVQLLLRQLDPAFARLTATASAAGGTPPPPWTNAYTYPTDCLRLRQIRPTPGSYNINDPQPIRGQVGFYPTTSTRAIFCNLATASLTYTSSSPDEDDFDLSFCEALARRLANPLNMAIAGRPDFARELLAEAERYSQVAELTDDV